MGLAGRLSGGIGGGCRSRLNSVAFVFSDGVVFTFDLDSAADVDEKNKSNLEKFEILIQKKQDGTLTPPRTTLSGTRGPSSSSSSHVKSIRSGKIFSLPRFPDWCSSLGQEESFTADRRVNENRVVTSCWIGFHVIFGFFNSVFHFLSLNFVQLWFFCFLKTRLILIKRKKIWNLVQCCRSTSPGDCIDGILD